MNTNQTPSRWVERETRNRLARFAGTTAVGAGALALSNVAMAAAIDTSSLQSDISDNRGSLETVGLVIVGVSIVLLVIHMLQRMIK